MNCDHSGLMDVTLGDIPFFLMQISLLDPDGDGETCPAAVQAFAGGGMPRGGLIEALKAILIELEKEQLEDESESVM